MKLTQGGFVLMMLLGAFVMWLAINSRINAYLAIIGIGSGGGSASAATPPSSPTVVAPPATPGTGTGGPDLAAPSPAGGAGAP